jgi:nitrogen fixation NifU-like protein
MDLQDLYREVILDHNKNPRNKRRVEDANRHASGYNPLCGDMVSLTLHTEGDKVTDIAFEGEGCAISTASASMMTEAIKGKTVKEAEEIFRAFQKMVTTPGEEPEIDDSLDEELQALAGVRGLPVRIKCAILPWHALHAALSGEEKEVTTE